MPMKCHRPEKWKCLPRSNVDECQVREFSSFAAVRMVTAVREACVAEHLGENAANSLFKMPVTGHTSQVL